MTPLEDKLRAAIRATANEIPAAAPPLRLDRRRRHGGSAGYFRARHRRAWVTPLAAAAVVVAVIAASLALTGGPDAAGRAPAGPQTASAGVPPYYVALVTGHGEPSDENSPGVAAEVRATLTGAVLARIVPPKPYATFTGVTAAADDRTFVLAAQGSLVTLPNAQHFTITPGPRFYLLHIDPASATSGGRASLQALPASFSPHTVEVLDMALSPDGTRLAANLGDPVTRWGAPLYVFNLATGAKRVWSSRLCDRCVANGGGLGFTGTNVDALSWGADSRHLALVGPGRQAIGLNPIRLLDTDAPGTDLIADSKVVAGWPNANTSAALGTSWRGVLITPDEQSVLAVLELVSSQSVRQQLVEISAVTGKVTATLSDRGVAGEYEQVLYTNTTGSALVVSYARPGMSAGIMRDGRYTPIPWTTQTITAAW